MCYVVDMCGWKKWKEKMNILFNDFQIFNMYEM